MLSVCLATWVLLWGALPWVPSGIVVVRGREPAVPVLGAAREAVPRVLAVILYEGYSLNTYITALILT